MHGWDMDFRRALTVQEYSGWLELTDSLNEFKPDGMDADIVLWALEPKRQLSKKSLYRFLTNRVCLVGLLVIFGNARFL